LDDSGNAAGAPAVAVLLNKMDIPTSYKKMLGMPAVRSKNERVELEMKILRYRRLARQIATDPDTAQRIKELIADLEKELRAIDE
jgi:hypothetical protein